MSTTVERFKPWHARVIDLQPAQADARNHMSDDYLEWLSTSGPAATMLRDDGVVIACAGVSELEKGSIMWALVSRDARPHMVAIVRGARRVIEVARKPIAAAVEQCFQPGDRLARLLGFQHVAQPPPIDGVPVNLYTLGIP